MTLRQTLQSGRVLPRLWPHRFLLWYLILRNLRSQYKKSIFGYAWVFLQPLAQVLVYSFVFATILRTPGQESVPFLLFLLVGLIPWVFFTNAVAAATDSISGGGSLITAVYLPRELLTVAAVLTRFVDLLAGLLIVLLFFTLEGQPLGWGALWVIPILVVQLVFTLGVVFPLAALNLFYRDVRFLVAVGLNLWFFATPIMYPLSLVPERYRIVYDLNPMARFVASYRYAVFDNVAPPVETLAWATAVSLVAFILGYQLFRRMEPSFADNI